MANSIYDFFFNRGSKQPNGGGVVVFTPGGTYTKSGVSVTPEDALKEPTVMSCINVIGQSVAQLSVSSGILNKPNDWQTASDFKYAIVQSVLAYGNAYIRIVRGTTGKPAQLIIADPNEVTVESNPFGIPQYKIKEAIIPHKDMVHIRDVPTFGAKGLSRVSLASERIGALIAADALIASTFKTGVDIKYVVNSNSPMDADTAEQYSDAIQKGFGAGGDKRSSAALIQDGSITQLKGATPADADLRLLRQDLIREIAGVFRVPPFMVGVSSDQKFSNVKQLQSSLYRDTILPIVTEIEQAFNLKLGGNIKFDITELIKGDVQAQMDYASQGLTTGMFTPNEARAYLGYDEIEGGDELASPNTAPAQTTIDDSQTGTDDNPNATDGSSRGGSDEEE